MAKEYPKPISITVLFGFKDEEEYTIEGVVKSIEHDDHSLTLTQIDGNIVRVREWIMWMEE